MTEIERSHLAKIEELSGRLTRAEMALGRARVTIQHPSRSGNAQAIAEIDRALSTAADMRADA